MMKPRTLLRLKSVALVACLLASGTVFSTACTMKDFSSNVVAGTLSAVKTYVQNFWITLVPDLRDAITASNNAGIDIPNPPWP